MLIIHCRNLLRRIASLEKTRTISLTGCRRDENEDSDNPKIKAAKKLNLLLQSIIKDDSIVKEDVSVEKLASETSKFKKKKIKKEEKPKTLGQKVVEAAKDVAENIKGDQEHTEAELLQKLLYKNENLQKSVLSASSNKQLSKLISEMKVEKTPVTSKKQIKDAKYSRADHVRTLLQDSDIIDKKKMAFPLAPEVKLDIFGETPLGIFKTKTKSKNDELRLDTWEHCHAREIRLSVTHPPSNIYEQMIIWTDRGIMWKFPIDNEQGTDEEKTVSFADHVFLENYLEDWCPDRGPIRHFMELVCVGLSRNYWLTAKEKKDHMMWYKEYFSQKKELIKEIGAGDIKISSSAASDDSLPAN